MISIHLGSSGKLAFTAADAPMDVLITLQPMNICSAAADLLWSRVIKEHPTIKIALSEGGTGWIPYFLDRIDRTYDMHHLWTGQDFGDRLPSEVFRDHFLTCFIADPVGIRLRDLIGIDNIAWECDYPHSDSSWPDAPEELAAVAVDVPDDELDKITYQNAMRWYSYDPFAHVPKAEATVGALRAKAAGHDVSIRSFDKGRFERTGKGVDLGDHHREGHRLDGALGSLDGPCRPRHHADDDAEEGQVHQDLQRDEHAGGRARRRGCRRTRPSTAS